MQEHGQDDDTGAVAQLLGLARDIFDTPVTVVPGPNGPIACYF